MTVWILASLLSLAVLLLLFLPLFRRTPPLRGHKASDGVEVSETRSDDAAKPANFLIAVSLVVLVPVFSFTVYGWLGKPSLPGLPYAERRSTHEVDPSSLHALVENLAQRMREGPDRLEGWQLLGRFSKQLKNYAKAAHAFRQAARLVPDDPIMHVELAEALFMAAGQSFDPDSVGALDKALEIEPRLPKALFYRGLAHRQAGDNRAAVQDWTNLVAVSPPDAPYLISVRGQIAAAAKEGNIDLSTIRPRFTSTKGPTAEELEAASQMSVDERQAFIRSMVTRLTTRLQEEPGDAAGWRRLARAYQVLGEPKKAADAEARARQAELGGVEGERPAGPGKKTPGNRPWN